MRMSHPDQPVLKPAPLAPTMQNYPRRPVPQEAVQAQEGYRPALSDVVVFGSAGIITALLRVLAYMLMEWTMKPGSVSP